MLRRPTERPANSFVCRDDRRGVARPARGNFNVEINARNPLHQFDYFENGKAALIAAICGEIGAAVAKITQERRDGRARDR